MKIITGAKVNKKQKKKASRKKTFRLRDLWPEMPGEDRVDLLKRAGYTGAAQLWYSDYECDRVPGTVRSNLGEV